MTWSTWRDHCSTGKVFTKKRTGISVDTFNFHMNFVEKKRTPFPLTYTSEMQNLSGAFGIETLSLCQLGSINLRNRMCTINHKLNRAQSINRDIDRFYTTHQKPARHFTNLDYITNTLLSMNSIEFNHRKLINIFHVSIINGLSIHQQTALEQWSH